MAIKVQKNDTIEDIINKSVREYQIVKKVQMPQFMETLINDANSGWEDGGYNYNTFVFTIFKRKNFSLLNVNMQTNIITTRYKGIYKFYDPIKNEFVEFIPEANKEFNLRTRKFEYFNKDTGEWTDRTSKKDAKNISDTVKMYYSIKNKAFIYFDDKGKIAIYRPDAEIWGFNDGKNKETKYFRISDGKRIVIEKKLGEFVVAKQPKKIKNQEKEPQEKKKIEVKPEEYKKDLEPQEKQEEQTIETNSQRINFLNSVSNKNKALIQPTKSISFANWLRAKKEKILSFFHKAKSDSKYYGDNARRNMHLLFGKENRPNNIEKVQYRNESPKQEVTNKQEKYIYRSQATKNKMLSKKLKLAKLKEGLKFKDTKRSIMYLAGAALILGGSMASISTIINKIEKNSQNNSSISIDMPTEDLSKDYSFNGMLSIEPINQYIEKQPEKNSEVEEKDNIEKEETNVINANTQENNNVNKNNYIVPEGTIFGEKSTNEGKKGTFKKDTEVTIYNRAIVKKDANGKYTTILSTDGLTWEEFSKKTGMSMTKINEMLTADENKEMVAVQQPGSRDIRKTYGWIEVSKLRDIQDKDAQER